MKKILSVLLAAFMLLSVGCSKNLEDKDSKDTTTSKETEAVTTDTENRDNEVKDFLDALADNYTVKDETNEQFVAVYTVPDFYEISKLMPEGEKYGAADLIDLAKDNPDIVKTLEVTVKRDDEKSLEDKFFDAMFFEVLCKIIGSVEVDLSDPSERTEASNENS